MGRITTVTSLQSLKQASAEEQVLAALLGSGNHFALEVVGEPLTGTGIMDGDTVIIEQREDARNGDVVAASIDESAATLKSIFRRSGLIELPAENH